MKKLEADLEEQKQRIELVKEQTKLTEKQTKLTEKQTDEADTHCALMKLQIHELQAKLAGIEFVDEIV